MKNALKTIAINLVNTIDARNALKAEVEAQGITWKAFRKATMGQELKLSKQQVNAALITAKAAS